MSFFRYFFCQDISKCPLFGIFSGIANIMWFYILLSNNEQAHKSGGYRLVDWNLKGEHISYLIRIPFRGAYSLLTTTVESQYYHTCSKRRQRDRLPLLVYRTPCFSIVVPFKIGTNVGAFRIHLHSIGTGVFTRVRLFQVKARLSRHSNSKLRWIQMYVYIFTFFSDEERTLCVSLFFPAE